MLLRIGALCALLAALCAFGGMAEEIASGEGKATVEAPPASIEPAQPDEAPPASVEPARLAEADAPYAGIWIPFEDGFRLYLPRAWSSMNITEAEAAAGLFYRAGAEGGTEGVAVGGRDSPGSERHSGHRLRPSRGRLQRRRLLSSGLYGLRALCLRDAPVSARGGPNRRNRTDVAYADADFPGRLKNLDGHAGKTRTDAEYYYRGVKCGLFGVSTPPGVIKI